MQFHFRIMAELTTMGELAARPCPAGEEEAFTAVLHIIDENFPDTWRSWEVYDYSFQDLFGTEVSAKIESKLRFAIPTADLARAFAPESSSLSERKYRSMRTKILHWPLGRALVHYPHHIMEKIHGSGRYYYTFVEAVRTIKSKLTNRRSASSELQSSQQDQVTKSSSAPTNTEPLQHTAGRKRSHEPVLEAESTPSKQTTLSRGQGSNEHLLITVLNQQMEMFNRLIDTQNQQNDNIEKILTNTLKNDTALTPDLNESFESIPDSTICSDDKRQSSQHNTYPSGAPLTDILSTRESKLRAQISEAQRELSAIQSEDNETYDFNPITTVTEPKVAKTDPHYLKQGVDCQRFGQEGWRDVRYADTQKQFQASPAFCALKVNNLLASVTPNWKSAAVLEKFDMTLGAITHGLLQQRRIFKELLDHLPHEIKRKIGSDFLNTDSQFKKKSDALLQYVCGRRAEVIEQRRGAYKVQNKALYDILHSIPPSETHLFSDEALSNAVKDCSNSDIKKLFPYLQTKKPSKFRSKDKSKETTHGASRQHSRYYRGQGGASDMPRFKTKTKVQHHHKTQSQSQPKPQQSRKNWGGGKRK